ncbi:MAG: hypothetical protein ABI591_03670 [Kofleriaceae bacterium]
MWRVLLCCVVIASACAGDNRVDPSELELRDVLGMAPETAMAWDAGQRAAARDVIDAGMHDVPPAPIAAAFDRSLASTLAIVDAGRAKQRLAALGVVALAVDHDEVRATARWSTLAPRATSFEIELAGWDRPGWAQLAARGLDVLATIASDAGHRGGPIVVTPAAQLAVIAAYTPATSTSSARLLVNPVVLASLEPVAITTANPIARTTARSGDPIGTPIARTTAGAVDPIGTPSLLARTGAPSTPVTGPRVVAADPVGNPYNFYGSIGECAAAQQLRCEACLPTSTCTPVTGAGDGNAECAQLAAGLGRGFSLLCINFALAIDSISSCATTTAPSCPFDARAGESISTLESNSDFLDQASCAGSLDSCLANVFGPAPTSTTTPPGNTSTDCSDSACEADPSCADNGCDGSCDSSSDSSAGDGCSSSDSSGCDSSDSGGGCGGDSGGDCGGDSGGDCSGGGADDCSGGGGNDCDAGGHHRSTSSHSFLWACLPLPFAIIARRRADRRRAKREVAS